MQSINVMVMTSAGDAKVTVFLGSWTISSVGGLAVGKGFCSSQFKNFFVLLCPWHMKYVGVYSFHICLFVRWFVCSCVRTLVGSSFQKFCIKVYKTSYFEDSLMDSIHIWPDGRYRSSFYLHHPHPGVGEGGCDLRVKVTEFSWKK